VATASGDDQDRRECGECNNVGFEFHSQFH
jgi:hypothetical protein